MFIELLLWVMCSINNSKWVCFFWVGLSVLLLNYHEGNELKQVVFEVVCRLLGVTELSGTCKGEHYFYNNTEIWFAFFTVCGRFCTEVGKPAGPLGRIKGVPPSCMSDHCILQLPRSCRKKKIKASSIRECPWWSSKNRFIKFQPLRTYLYSTLSDKMRSTQKALFCNIPESTVLVSKNSTRRTELSAEVDHRFYLTNDGDRD